MKYAVWVLALAIWFPTSVFAASGACSGHGGVNCSSGADSDGSVICSDGWRGSRVSYSSMVKCQGNSAVPSVIPITPPIAPKPATTVESPISSPRNVAIPESVKQPAIKENANPVENKDTGTASSSSQLEANSVSPAITIKPESNPAPKKMGFWARLFSFIF